MEARVTGIKRLRRLGALAVAGGATLFFAAGGVDLWSVAWVLGAALGAEVAARAGGRIAGRNAAHALWLGPLCAVTAAAFGGFAMAGIDGRALAILFGIGAAPIALAWGGVVGLISTLVESGS